MSRRTKIALALLLGVFLLGVAGLAFKVSDARQFLEQQREEAKEVLERTGTRGFERTAIEPWPDALPADERITDLRAIYDGAAHAAKDVSDRYFEEDDSDYVEPLFVRPAPDAAEAAAWSEGAAALLARFPEPLQLLRQALHASRLSADTTLRRGVLPADDPRFKRYDALADWVTMNTERALRAGESGPPLEMASLRILWGHDMARGGGLVVRLLGANHAGRAADVVKQALRLPDLAEADLVRLRKAIEAVDGSAWSAPAMWEIEAAALRFTVADSFLQGGTYGGEDASMAHLFVPELMGASWLRSLNAVDARVTPVMKLPMRERAEPFAALAEEIRRGDEMLPKLIGGMLPLALERELTSACQWVLMKAATAVALHRVRTGQSPESLAMVGAETLLCPASGQPLHYEGGRVWSVGPDRTNDGGRPLDTDAAFLEAKGDLAWDVRPKAD